MEDSYAKFVLLLEKANLISVSSKRQRNFFEVAGFPNYENVASSILAFFFDTCEEHGLKDLWLSSLLECYKSKTVSNDDTLFYSDGYETLYNGVVREEVTTDNKRIDILIPTRNDLIVAIENKLFADIYNPFDKYSEWICSEYKQYSNKVEIVLSLYPVKESRLLDGVDSLGNTYHFVNITYSELLTAVRNNVGSYIVDANDKWLIYMNEFIKNIDSLQEVRMTINRDWQLFLEENNDLITEYNRKMQNDLKAKSDLVNTFAVSLQERFDNDSIGIPTKTYTYGTQSYSSYISLVIDIKKDDTVIVIEPRFFKPGYEKKDDNHLGVFYITVWVRQKDARESVLTGLKDFLSMDNIPYTDKMSRSWGEYLEIKEYDYREEINNQVVEDDIFHLWEVITKYITKN